MTPHSARGAVSWLLMVASVLLETKASAQVSPGSAEPVAIVVTGLRPTRDANELRLGANAARREAGTQGDPVKAIENLPGLARSSFGSEQLVLWGAAPEASRIYVDGVEIPQLFHESGIRSTLNGALIQSITLTPGAYGANYGRGIGGMVRIETRALPEDGAHASVDVNTLDGSLLIAAPLSARVRVAVAGRLGWLAQTLGWVTAKDVGAYFAVPDYSDYQAKLELALRARESVDLSVLGSADEFSHLAPSSDPGRVRSSTQRRGFERLFARYRRSFGDDVKIEVVPWLGRDRDNSEARSGSTVSGLDQQITRWGLRAEHESRLAAQLILRLGVDSASSHARLVRDGSLTIPHREGDLFVFGQAPGADTNHDDWQVTVLDVAPYASVDWARGPFSVTAALRFDGYLIEASRKTPRVGQTPSLAEARFDTELGPRVSARYRLSEQVTFFAALGAYSQPPAAQDLSAVFGSPSLGPETARHASLGETLNLSETLSASVTGFYEALSNLVVRDPSPTPALARALVQTGSGRSYGLQASLRQSLRFGFFGSLACTLSRSERRAAPTAVTRLFDYDEPLLLSVVAGKLLGSWTLSARLRYASGAPRTPVVGALYDEKDAQYQPVFGAQNSLRLPAFAELDLRAERSFRVTEAGRLIASLELLNLTNRKNAEEYAYSLDYSRRGAVTGLPFLGVAGVRLEL